jgi:hypothetical protein
MTMYRCPICGANHKQQIANCRLCGQNMSGEMIPVGTVHVAAPIQTKGGIKGIVFLAVGAVVLIVAAAVGLGLVRSNSVIEGAKNAVVGNDADGWTVQADAAGRYSIQLPGNRTNETVDFPSTDNGKLNIWTAKVGNDIVLHVGFGPVTPPAATTGAGGSVIPQTATLQLFLQQLAAKWMAQNGLTDQLVTTAETGIGGLPAYTVRSNAAKFTLNTQDAYMQAAFMLRGTTLYVIETTSIYKDAEQLDRMAGTFKPS